MSDLDVAIVGTGPDPENPDWGTSAAMAYKHALAYQDNENCTLVACADLVPEHAAAFADRFGITDAYVFEDYKVMLAETQPAIVSVCTPVPTHAEIVSNCAKSDAVRAIHCEKPMADTWNACEQMTDACQRADVQLTFNHQRRFTPVYREAKRLIDTGVLGTLRRFEVGGKNLFDFGCHLLDICYGLNGESSPIWTICQVDYRTRNVRYGTHNENQALALWEYENGVHGFLSSGTGADAIGTFVRVIGEKGELELWPSGETPLRIHHNDEIDKPIFDTLYETPIHGAIEDLISTLGTDNEPALQARNILPTNELIFGCWESARQRGRIEFPLDISDNPLTTMIETDDLTPE